MFFDCHDLLMPEFGAPSDAVCTDPAPSDKVSVSPHHVRPPELLGVRFDYCRLTGHRFGERI